ncbi:MAG: HAD-IC family P-type ATPase [Gemmatimonadetes bacterium]|nr:HAD-IC family P-type ATPase [Gemmatimonadota bacterium]
MRVNPARGELELAWNPRIGTPQQFLRDVERFGYRFGPAGGDDTRPDRGLLTRLGICASAAMNVMIVSACFYFGLSRADEPIYTILGYLGLVFAGITTIVGGDLFIRSVLRGARRGLVHLDLPIALGIVLAFASSVVMHVTRGPEFAYYDTTSAFVTLMVAGRWLQQRAVERNRRALLRGAGVDHLFARRREGDRVTSVPVRDIHAEDELWVVPGEFVPVRALPLQERRAYKLDWITGEPRVFTTRPGVALPAGATNAGEQMLRVRAIEDFADSKLLALLGGDGAPGDVPDDRETDTAGDEDRWWRNVSVIYVAFVLLTACAGLFVWRHDWARAIPITISLLVITCPCAIGFALPLARELAHNGLRRAGVFVRKPHFLDRALHIKRVIFDKTGTLTNGTLRLDPASRRDLFALSIDDRRVLAGMAARSNHPVSRALWEELDQEATADPDWIVREVAGRGLELVVNRALYRLGSAPFATLAALPDSREETIFSRDGVPLLRIRLEEQIREDARDEVDRLHEMGFDIAILTGDGPRAAGRVARAIGIPKNRVLAGLRPEEKARTIREWSEEPSLMVGDGLNDGPALSEASCAATPAIDHAAVSSRTDFYYLGDGIGAVRMALAEARRLRKVTRNVLILAVIYNLAAISVALAGGVSPLVAALAMPASSILILTYTVHSFTGVRTAWKR